MIAKQNQPRGYVTGVVAENVFVSEKNAAVDVCFSSPTGLVTTGEYFHCYVFAPINPTPHLSIPTLSCEGKTSHSFFTRTIRLSEYNHILVPNNLNYLLKLDVHV